VVAPIRCLRYASSDSQPAKTGLYDLHASHGAKFVPFAGYQMPVQYSDLSISESHNWTREKASLFDVGHMYAIYHRSALLNGN
jgi:aminomethyltransferase